jgi:hypothetical protein
VAVPDVVAAVVAYLRADAAVLAIVGTRVFGEELPGSEAASMPRASVVVSATGGYGQTDAVPLMKPRVDVRCYGATRAAAMTLHLAVYVALRALSRAVSATGLLHGAIEEGGPQSLRDQDTDWPLVWSSWIVLVGEEAVV